MVDRGGDGQGWWWTEVGMKMKKRGTGNKCRRGVTHILVVMGAKACRIYTSRWVEGVQGDQNHPPPRAGFPCGGDMYIFDMVTRRAATTWSNPPASSSISVSGCSQPPAGELKSFPLKYIFFPPRLLRQHFFYYLRRPSSMKAIPFSTA